MIILAQINFSKDHAEKILPLGILSIGSALKKFGHEVRLIVINEDEIEKVSAEIAKEKPEIFGLSVITGVQTRHSAELSKKIKALAPGVPILWGGIHPSLLPEQCLKEDYVDFIIIGEGEETMNDLAAELKGEKNFSKILGLGFKENGRAIINPRRPFIKNLSDWRLDFSLLDVNRYIYPLGKYKRVIAYKASRGCPFGCAFCYNHEFNENKWRAWPVDAVVEDLKLLKEKHGIDAVKFYDDNFFVDKRRALEILEKINLPSHLEVRIDFMDDELARELKRLKVFDMLIGLESGSDRILKMIDKNFTVEKMIEGVKSIAKYDLHATYSFIVGLPTETKEEFNKTIGLMYEIYKIHPRAGFTLGAYLPYPGSKLYRTSIEQGFNPPKDTEGWGNIDRFRKDFRSPWVSAKKVWIIRECYKIMSWDAKIFKKWFEFRIKHGFYALPVDIYLVEFLADIALEEKNIFGRTLRRLYNFLRGYGSSRDNMDGRIKNLKDNKKPAWGKMLSGKIYPEFFPIEKNESVLNVGCGNGVQAALYNNSYKKMTGVDINPVRLELSKEVIAEYGVENFSAIEANVEKIPLDEKFDKAIAIDIIEHVVHPEAVIGEIRRLIKDGGQLLITFPAMHDKWENAFRFVGRKILRRKGKTVRKEGWDPDAHQYDYSLSDWMKIMEKGGFQLVLSRASTMFPPLHYLGLPRFWFSNKIIHMIDNRICQLPVIKNYGQALVCVFEKK